MPAFPFFRWYSGTIKTKGPPQSSSLPVPWIGPPRQPQGNIRWSDYGLSLGIHHSDGVDQTIESIRRPVVVPELFLTVGFGISAHISIRKAVQPSW